MYRNASDFNCDTCDHKYCDNNNPAPYQKWKIDNVGEFNTCLLPMITAETNLLIRLYQHYKNGVLPFSGGLMDQPNNYLQAMEFISQL